MKAKRFIAAVAATLLLTAHHASTQGNSGAQGFQADRETQRVLDRARLRIGAKVASVTSLSVHGTRQRGARGTPSPFSAMSLLPSAYQDSRAQGSDVFTFTLNGDEFWQVPVLGDPGLREMARKNVRARFAEHCLVFLIRGCGGTLQAAVVPGESDGVTVLVTGAGGFRRVLVFDKGDGRLKALVEEGTLSQGSRTSTVLRRVAIGEHRTVSGLSLPVRWTERIGATEAHVQIDKVEVNPRISRAVFTRR